MATSLNASLNVTLNPQSLNQASRQVQQALGRITGQASEFQKSLDASTARVFAFGATTVVLNGVTQSFKKLVSTTIEVEKRLLEINSIFQATEVTFNRFRNSIFNVAKETGQSFNTVAEGAAELARQGLSAEETASRLKSALVLTRISGMDAEKSVKALTAAINGFSSAGLKHNEIVNKMVAVDTAFAVSTEDLAEAFSRAGSTAEDAGVSFDQLLGLVTAVEQRTARGGAVIGNAFKSIFTRLARGTTIGKLQELGVQIDATQSGVQKLKALSDALETVGDPTVAAKIKELAGGVFQINVVSAALKDIGSESSIFANATKASVGAVNEAFEKNAMLSEGMAHQINALVQGLTSLAEKVGSLTFGPLLENLIGVADTFVGFLDKALDPEKGNVFIKGFFKAIGTFLSGPAVVMFTGAFIKIFGLVAKFAKEGLSSLLKMGTQADRVRTIEAGIVGLLQRDENLRNQINSSTITQAQKEQLVIDAIRQENTLLSQQASIMRGLATAAAMRGVGGFGPTGFTGRKGKGRFSMGFRAEEAEARALGAPAGVRARLSEGTIGGERAIINNHETEIRNFAGGRDSAIIPHYAGGFVPNYSRRNLNSIINSTRKKGEFGYKTPAEKEAARKKLAEMDKRAADKANMKRLPLTGAGKGMFVPLLNYKDTVKAHQGTFKKGKHTIPYDLQGSFKVRGPQLPSGIEAAGDPEDDRLKDNVIKDIAKRSRQFSNTLTPITKRNAASTAEVKKALMEQGGGKGAIHAAIGAAFEAAVVTGLKLKNKQKKKGGDFDVRPVTEKIRELFYGEGKAKSTILGDFKSSDSPDNRNSFIKKIANEKYKNSATSMLTALGRKSKARGYIPNYAGAGGVPLSMMRVHKDDAGSPVAVTNLRDEPNGLQDALKRERQGIGMFASGFIPNYFGAGMKGGKMQVGQNAVNKQVLALGKYSKEASEGLEGVGDKSTALMSVMFGVQMVMGMFQASAEKAVTARKAEEEEEISKLKTMEMEASQRLHLMDAEKRKTSEVEKSTQSLMHLSETIQTVISSMMVLSALNTFTGGGLGRLGGGIGKRLGFGAAAKSAASDRITRQAMAGNASRFMGLGRRRAMPQAQARQFADRRVGLRSMGRGTAGIGAAISAAAVLTAAMDKSASSAERANKMRSAGFQGGGAIAGAMAGQAAIPIPIVGALIGAAVGAFGGDWLNKQLGGRDAATEWAEAEGRATKTMRLGMGEKDFNASLNEGVDRIEKGIGMMEWMQAKPEERKKMLRREATEEGKQKTRELQEKAVQQKAELRDAEAGVGINWWQENITPALSSLFGGDKDPKQEAIDKKRAALEKTMLTLTQKTYRNKILEEKLQERVTFTVKALLHHQRELAKLTFDTPLAQAQQTTRQAGRDMAEANMGLELMKTLKGLPLQQELGTFMGAEAHMRGIQGEQAIIKEATLAREMAEKGISRVTLKEGENPFDKFADVEVDHRTIPQLETDIAEAGDRLKDKIKDAAMFLAGSINDVSQAQLQVAKQLDEVSASIIQRAGNLIDARMKGEGLRFEDVTDDAMDVGQMIKGFIANPENVDTDGLMKAWSELDTGKFGDKGEMVAHMAGITQQTLSEALRDLSMRDLIDPERARKLDTDFGDPTQAQGAQELGYTFLAKQHEQDVEAQTQLSARKLALTKLYDKMIADFEKLTGIEGETEGGEGQAAAIKDFAEKLKKAGTSIEGFGNFTETFSAQTNSTAELLGQTTALNQQAVGAMTALSKKVQEIEAYVATLGSSDSPLSQPVPSPVGRKVGGVDFVPNPNVK